MSLKSLFTGIALSLSLLAAPLTGHAQPKKPTPVGSKPADPKPTSKPLTRSPRMPSRSRSR